MKQSQRAPSIFFNLILFAGLAVVWIAFAPTQIGGQVSYIMVNGISMEPNYHTGDLVVVRKAQAYQVGDVVTYRDAQMGGTYVIHRIIAIEQDHYVFKGDNNSWIDAYRPTRDELVGKQWIYAPKFGRGMMWLRTPINLSFTIVLLGGVLMTSMKTKSSQGKKGKNHPSLNSGGMLEGTLYVLGLLFLGFLGLAIFAFIKPLTRTADAISYQQDGNYFYSATGTPGVYDTEMVRSGEPIFPKLTCFLNIGFTYTILGSQLQDIAGSHQMFARVMDQQSGWLRTIPIIPQTAFSGNSYFSMAALDLCQVTALLEMVEKETGLHAGAYTIEIVTNVAFAANALSQPITDTFDPILTFKFDKVHLYLANTNAESDTMHLTKQGLAASASMQANTLPLLGWEPTVGFIRVLALLGLGLSLGGLVVMGFSVLNKDRQSEEAHIRLRYGSMIMDVYERSLNANLPLIDVTSIDDLAKMAEHQNTMIMHMTLNFLHYYLVQSNGAIYRYIVSAGKSGVSEKEPARQEVIAYIASDDEYIHEAPRPIQAEATACVTHTEMIHTTKVQPELTEMLRKIRI